MISRRNYFVITIMMLILFFMFQFTGVMKERLNEYDVNEYVDSARTLLGEKDAYTVEHAVTNKNRETIAYVGGISDDMQEVVSWWCIYTKRTLNVYTSVTQLKKTEDETEELPPKVLLLDGSRIQTKEDIQALDKMAGEGTNMVFLKLPDYQVIAENRSLQKLLGIRHVVADDFTMSGIHLFDGFLLGGEAIYEAKDEADAEKQDLERTLPWYITGEGTKTYASGTVPKETLYKEISQDILAEYGKVDSTSGYQSMLPGIIWRNSTAGGQVFCVNSTELFEDMTGIGILDAIMSQMKDYEIYPVINAQNLVLAGYPSFGGADEEEIMKRYSQTYQDVQSQIIWPSLNALAVQNGDKLTCMMTLTGEEDETADYLRLMKEEHWEAGVNGAALSGEEPLDNDCATGYRFQTLCLQDEEALQKWTNERDSYVSVVTKAEKRSTKPPVSYLTGTDIVVQRGTDTGVEHTFWDDLKLKSLETALAYSDIVIDMERTAYPESDEDSWERMSKKIAANVSTYQKPFRTFDETTLSESNQRVRRFLALDFLENREDNVISLQVENFEESAWFLLRTNGEEVVSVDGGEYVKLEKDAYLIQVLKEQVSIELEPDSELYYHGGVK